MPDHQGKILPIVGEALIALTQCVLSGGLLQTFANAKSLTESGKSLLTVLKTNPKVLTTGFHAGALYSILAMFPPKLMADVCKGDPSDRLRYFGISAAATVLESSFGVPLEAHGATQTLKSIGVDIAGQKMKAAHRAFYPFLIRNNLGWLVFTNSTESLGEKAALGAVAGLVTAPLDMLGNWAMKNVGEKTLLAGYKASIADIKKMPFGVIAAAALVRSIGISSTSVLMSDQFQNLLSGVFNPLMKQADVTGSSVSNPAASQVADRGKSDAKKGKGEMR